jgi:two-component system sensor histidine kinase KdpD
MSQNLLDMTRLGHGALTPKAQSVDLREVVGRVRGDLARILAVHDLVVDMVRDLPRALVDPVLIGQALANVVENAGEIWPSPADASPSAAAPLAKRSP